MPARATAATVLLALLAGCSDPAPDDLDPTAPGQQDAARVPNNDVPHPGWDVGDWWEHEWVFAGENAPAPFTVKSIVAANASGTYTFATDSLATAAQHGAFFFMDLGTMGPDGNMVAGGYSFPWYEFPLEHNKTWTAREVNLGPGLEPVTRELELVARETGPNSPIYTIEATVDGALYAAYDFDARLGWFSTFTTYAPGEDGAPEPVYTITNTGQGTGFSGPVFSATGDLLVNAQPLLHPGAPSAPASLIAFEPDAGHTHVFAILFSFAAAGAHHTQMVAPDGQHWEATGTGDPDGNPVNPPGVSSGTQVLQPSQPGGWHVAFGGAGLVAGGGALVWGITVAESTV